jgi:hypothetical protein
MIRMTLSRRARTSGRMIAAVSILVPSGGMSLKIPLRRWLPAP